MQIAIKNKTMNNFFKEFFTITGIGCWISIIFMVLYNLIFLRFSKKKEKREEFYCSNCKKDTMHVILGWGFNESHLCDECNNIRV